MSLLAINRNGGEAVYSQIARLLEEQIQQFNQPGDMLPSEQVLAAQFGVNRHTVRRAIEQLSDNGLVERRHGRGTFVLELPLDYAIGQTTRFTESLEAAGLTARNRIIHKQVIPARGGVAQRLGLAEQCPVLWIETLRYNDAKPICAISHFLPEADFPGLLDDYEGGSLHDFIHRRHHIRLRRVESLVTACLPQGDDAELLGMPRNRPVLRVKSVNIDTLDQRPLEYALTRFRADRIQLCIRP